MRQSVRNLAKAAAVPVATAIFGASGSGKSLLIGRLVGNQGGRRILGLTGDDQVPETLDFARDLNPRLGPVENTAVVTRFTLGDRMHLPPKGHAATPVRACLFSTGDIIKALARGFFTECKKNREWTEQAIVHLVQNDLRADHGAASVDVEWRSDLVEAYRYLKEDLQNHNCMKADSAVLGQVLLQTPLSPDGYSLLACHLFWENWPRLSGLFEKLLELRKRRFLDVEDLLVPWEAVHFLLDSQRAPAYESPSFGQVAWKQMRLTRKADTYQLIAGASGERVPLPILQGIISEVQIPLVRERLAGVCQGLFDQADCLDIPGARSGLAGAAAMTAAECATEEKALEVLKRGKVGFLFDKFSAEMQARVVIYLQKKGPLDARSELRPQISSWGRTLFGEKWPETIPDDEEAAPSLLVGLTHIDDLLRLPPDVESFKAWLGGELSGNYEWFLRYGKRPFSNVFLLRYPGALDQADPAAAGLRVDEWKTAFLSCSAVEQHVEVAAEKWERCLHPEDGGLSLLVNAALRKLDNARRREWLMGGVQELRGHLSALMSRLYVDPAMHEEAAKRRQVAAKVIKWLREDTDGRRTRKLIEVWHCERRHIASAIAEESSPEAIVPMPPDYKKVVHRALASWLDDSHRLGLLAVSGVDAREIRGARENLIRLSSYIVDYLNTCCAAVLAQLLERIQHDVCEEMQAAAFGRYAEMVLDDYLLTPGPREPYRESMNVEESARPYVKVAERWERILADRLAAAIEGGGIQPPAGNTELAQIMKIF